MKVETFCCPRCNTKKLYKYGKDKFGNQKYQCPICKHQFAHDAYKKERSRKYPSCPKCGKSVFLHHDYDDYSNYRCSDKKCNHSFFQAKPTVKLPPSMSNIIGKGKFKRMRHSIHLVITALTLFYIGGSSFRKITTMLEMLFNIKVSHVTISDWCKKFAPTILLLRATVKSLFDTFPVSQQRRAYKSRTPCASSLLNFSLFILLYLNGGKPILSAAIKIHKFSKRKVQRV